MHLRRRGRAALLFSLLLVFSRSAAARADADANVNGCAPPMGAAPALLAQDTQARLRFIRDSMRETVRQERRYLVGWSLAYVGLATGTWLMVPLGDSPGQRIASAWNSATAIAGGLLALVQPLRVIADQRRLEARLARPGGGCAQLAEAERLLLRTANNEAGARTPLTQTLGIVTNVALGLILGYGLKQPNSAVISIPVGIAVTQVQIVTRPTLATRRLKSYLAGDLTPRPAPRATALIPLSIPIDGGHGVALAGTF